MVSLMMGVLMLIIGNLLVDLLLKVVDFWIKLESIKWCWMNIFRVRKMVIVCVDIDFFMKIIILGKYSNIKLVCDN